MNWWQLTIVALYTGMVLVTLTIHFYYTSRSRRIPVLDVNSPRFDGETPPLVSIMIPVKDEEASIRACLESVLAQDYPNFEVLVIDDRSEDRTAEIVQELADNDDRLRLLSNSELPHGWTGKTYALHQCEKSASGEWYLFVDADTTHHPSMLSILVEDCTRDEIGLTSLVPKLERHTFWERVVQPYAGSIYFFLVPLHRVNDPTRKTGYANGQVLFISKAGYDRVGGHQAVRDKLVEDVNLGRLAKKHGVPLRAALGPQLSSVRMYSSLSQIVRGWTRIFASTVDFHAKKLIRLTVRIAIISLVGYLVLIGSSIALLMGATSPFVWTLFGLAVTHELLQAALFFRIYRAGGCADLWQLLRPLSTVVVLVTLWKTIRMCYTRQVNWRGTQYGSELHQISA